MISIRVHTRIGPEGRVEIPRSELPEGARAEVIVVLPEETETKPEGLPYFGCFRHLFKSEEEVDKYIRELRDEWD